jgi:hypothetical protein
MSSRRQLVADPPAREDPEEKVRKCPYLHDHWDADLRGSCPWCGGQFWLHRGYHDRLHPWQLPPDRGCFDPRCDPIDPFYLHAHAVTPDDLSQWEARYERDWSPY